ncbi:MAG: IS1595 family transposase [Candidatus Dormiibacterota bacterium]
MEARDRNHPTRAKSSESRYSLMEFTREFPDDNACLNYLWRTRYSEDGEHAECPKCEAVRSFRRYETTQRRQSWTCIACGHHLHPTAGTIFHKSATSLHLWFYAMYLMTSTRCGISAKQLERELGVTYKTAWRIFHLIRNELMVQTDEPMTGAVEMDEMYVGGKPRQSDVARWEGMTATEHRQAAQSWSNESKTTVFGLAERKGRVAAHVVSKRAQAAIMGHITATVDPTSIVYTDDARIYDRLPKAGWDHRTINHSAKVYVQGDVHTQTIEGFWSLVKRGIGGTHHAVSPKHLQGYLNEYAWRYNHRHDARSQFETLLRRAAER